MHFFLWYLYGFVTLQLSGSELPRFLNLCNARMICFRDLECISPGQMQGKLLMRDFPMLLSVRRKTGVHIHIIKKSGVPFWRSQLQKKKTFLIGMLLGILFLFFLSDRIWNISIEGNQRNSDTELLLYLKEEGVVPGVRKKTISCSHISEMLREKYADITWVSTKQLGTQLNISVNEGFETIETEEIRPTSNLVADKNGKIVSIVTRSGIPLKKPGDFCEKGEILVLGLVEIRNDEQQIIRTEEIAADADVWIEREIPYYKEIPLKYEVQTPTEHKLDGLYFRIGKWYLRYENPIQKLKTYLGMSSAPDETANHCQIQLYTLPLLNLSIGKKEKLFYEKETVTRTEEEIIRTAEEKIEKYEKNLIEKGIQISANNVTIKVSDFICRSKGSITVLEQTGRSLHSATQKEKQNPTERNTEDGKQHY